MISHLPPSSLLLMTQQREGRPISEGHLQWSFGRRDVMHTLALPRCVAALKGAIDRFELEEFIMLDDHHESSYDPSFPIYHMVNDDSFLHA